MTFQIGMVGSDGVVVAGDTLQYEEPGDRPWCSYHSSKIRLSDDKRIAVFCAHDMHASFAIADEITRTLSDPSANRRIEIQKIGDRLAAGVDSACIIAFSDPYPAIFRLTHPMQGKSKCEEIYTRIPIGDQWNPAFFLTMRHYDSGLSCKQLRRLGAFTVVSAAHISSGSIGGLEGITCTLEGISLWERQESIALEIEMKELAKDLGTAILGP